MIPDVVFEAARAFMRWAIAAMVLVPVLVLVICVLVIVWVVTN